MSAILKCQVKMGALHEVGVRLDDQLEAAKIEAVRYEGASAGCIDAARSVTELHKHIDKELEDGKFGSLEEAQRVKDWITRCSVVCENLSKKASNQAIAAHGKVAQADTAVKLVKNMYEQEKQRVDAILVAVESEVPAEDGARVTGQRPKSPLKQRRLAEANGKEKSRGANA